MEKPIQVTLHYRDFVKLLCPELKDLVQSLIPEEKVGEIDHIGGFEDLHWGEPIQRVYYFTVDHPLTKQVDAGVFRKYVNSSLERIEFWNLIKDNRGYEMVVFSLRPFATVDFVRLKGAMAKVGVSVFKKVGMTFEE